MHFCAETTMSRQAGALTGERLKPPTAVVPLRAHPTLQGAIITIVQVVAGTKGLSESIMPMDCSKGKLQEIMDFPLTMGFSCKIPLKPIHRS